MEKFYEIVPVGLLTGRPEGEVSEFQADLLQELSKVHERARKAMRNMAKALWPSDSPPGLMGGSQSYSKELVFVLRCGRHQHVERVHKRPGPW